MFGLKRVDPAQSDVMDLIRQLDEYQESMYPPESNHLDPIDELSKPNVVFLAAYLFTEKMFIVIVVMGYFLGQRRNVVDIVVRKHVFFHC